jgi:hypothetical protein
MQVTLGAGLTRPQGKRVEVSGVAGFAQMLREADVQTEGWWSPHVFQGDYRDSEKWEATWCIGLDVDQEGHQALGPEIATLLEGAVRRGAISGSIFHRTPAGARIVFVLEGECHDADAFDKAAAGASVAIAEDLRELGINGLTVDPKPHRDLARLYFLPNCFAKGTQRHADVYLLRTDPYTLGDLAALLPEPPRPALRSVPKMHHSSGVNTPDAFVRASKYVEKMGPSVEGNHGDDHAFRVACALLRDFGLDDSQAWDILQDWNQACDPPWTDKDLQRFVRSASRNGSNPVGGKLLEDRPLPARATQVSAPAPTPRRTGLALVRAKDVTEEPVEWLIPGFVARRELTDLSGDPGVGKGGILASWAARVTSTSDEGVILFSTEDRLGHVKARLRAEGADLNRVLLLDIREANSNPILPGDIDLVEQAVREYRAALVAFDPALEFMGADLDSHKQQDVQLFAASLGNLAHRTGSAILTVRHNNKAQGVAAIYRSAGSIAFIARARMALMANKDKENGGRVLSVVKGNIGKDSAAVAFDIVEKDGSTVVAWGETVSITADELVNQDPKKRGRPPAAVEGAADLLRDVLAAGPMKIDDVLRCAKSEGVGRATTYRAKKLLKLESCTLDLHSAWRLPE